MGLMRSTAVWLGLVEDPNDKDDVDLELTQDYTKSSEPVSSAEGSSGRSSSPQTGTVTRLETKWENSAVAPSEPADEPSVADLSRIVTVHPRTFNEARVIGEHFRDQIPVIVNLTDMDHTDAKRLVDFSAGLIFGLRGTIERITSNVFLLSPHNVMVAAEDKERIAGGFFNQS
ncbi:cell division protein SepF [Propionicicella superfundia]|uniref:cell division protein SepF n=1 Tax=Propionicicella superfundia TaxID=348582 RepID=UPI00040DF37A|nr:cell division protein SepF [Propionicicella superfundia]